MRLSEAVTAGIACLLTRTTCRPLLVTVTSFLAHDLAVLAGEQLVLAGYLSRISLAPAPVMTISSPSMLTLTPGSSTSTISVPSGENRRTTVPRRLVTPEASVSPRPTTAASKAAAAASQPRWRVSEPWTVW